jgi:hypothetical protein
MTTGSSPPGARRSLSYYPPLSTRVRPADCGSVRLGTLGRSIFAQPERGFLEIAALRPTPSQSRPLASPCWSGRRPATRRAENDQIRSLLALRTVGREPATRAASTPKGHSGARTPTDSIPPSRKRGRAVLRGRPLRGRHSKNTDLFGRPCDRPSHVTLPHRGLAGSGAGGSALVLALCPTWALTAGGCTGSRRSGA